MIPAVSLSRDLLAEVGQELGGCGFTDEEQLRFLGCTTSCDVQAAPGNGKTTLLVAKLAILSRVWKSRCNGVCVISHTNAARQEVERHLSKHPTAAAFLSYPHFIGTVTTFLNQYLALPYLRGLGWTVQRIDDDHFEARALKAYIKKPRLAIQARMQKGKLRNQVETWVRQLELADDWECSSETAPDRLKVRHRKGQHGPTTDCGRELEELKAELVNEGLFRFNDLTILASRALEKCTTLSERLQSRFPLVILDEAQDTTGEQLALLERLFPPAQVAFQRLGDQNQTLYEQGNHSVGKGWAVGTHEISLPTSLRFGREIANFSSRLTIRSPQQIEGRDGMPSRRALILFDKKSIGKVVSAYATEVREHWPNRYGSDLDVWAVASRHKLYKKKGGGWPKSLVDYYPEYRAEGGSRASADTFCGLMQQASLLYSAGLATPDMLSLLTTGLAQYLHRNGISHPLGHKVTNSNVWGAVGAVEGDPRFAVRLLFRNRVLVASAAWNATAWGNYCGELKQILRLPDPPPERAASVGEYLAFAESDALTTIPDSTERSPKHTTIGGVKVKFGSIHSLKGRTVDSILVVESEIHLGSRAEDQAMDLTTVLPNAFGIGTEDLSSGVKLAAATNVFVGVTRTRELLGLALTRESASEALVAAALGQGWHVRDLTKAD